MNEFYGSEEKKLVSMKPKVEIPPELQRKQQKGQKHSFKQNHRKK